MASQPIPSVPCIFPETTSDIPQICGFCYSRVDKTENGVFFLTEPQLRWEGHAGFGDRAAACPPSASTFNNKDAT